MSRNHCPQRLLIPSYIGYWVVVGVVLEVHMGALATHKGRKEMKLQPTVYSLISEFISETLLVKPKFKASKMQAE